MTGRQFTIDYLTSIVKSNLSSMKNVRSIIQSELDNLDYLLDFVYEEERRNDILSSKKATLDIQKLSIKHPHKDDLLQAIVEYDLESDYGGQLHE